MENISIECSLNNRYGWSQNGNCDCENKVNEIIKLSKEKNFKFAQKDLFNFVNYKCSKNIKKDYSYEILKAMFNNLGEDIDFTKILEKMLIFNSPYRYTSFDYIKLSLCIDKIKLPLMNKAIVSDKCLEKIIECVSNGDLDSWTKKDQQEYYDWCY